MKGFSNGLKWITAAALLLAMSAAPAFAAKTTPATDKNTNVPAVPRAIPDLIPYHNFDPPKSPLFDLKNLTVSGDIRVRPEFRNNTNFTKGSNNDFFVQQWVRLGINYAISPDVDFFFQPQYSKTWGTATSGAGNTDANSGPTQAAGDGNSLFARQAFMLIRNFGVKNLTAKIGRQLVVWGNHRLFGHFDWNNVGWSHDGATLNYKLSDMITLESGWLRSKESDCTAAGGQGANGGGCGGGSKASADADIVFLRGIMKVAGITIEPAYIWGSGGTGAASTTGARPSDQSRHTVGARIATQKGLSNVMVDVTAEGYYQFGEIGLSGAGRNQDISAYALHLDGGVTLPVPMQPRIGAEINYATGDSNNSNGCTGANTAACTGTSTTFDQLFPTNHIHFGYMDKQAWKNMLHFAGTLQLRPTKDSHLEFIAHKFYLADSRDAWYNANQNANTGFGASATNTKDSVGTELDAVYTMFFTEGNHVGWQIGGGVFLPGDYIDNSTTGVVPDASSETWGYTQLWINF
jgi:hypothetical protein